MRSFKEKVIYGLYLDLPKPMFHQCFQISTDFGVQKLIDCIIGQNRILQGKDELIDDGLAILGRHRFVEGLGVVGEDLIEEDFAEVGKEHYQIGIFGEVGVEMLIEKEGEIKVAIGQCMEGDVEDGDELLKDGNVGGAPANIGGGSPGGNDEGGSRTRNGGGIVGLGRGLKGKAKETKTGGHSGKNAGLWGAMIIE